MVELFLDEESVEVQIFLGLIKQNKTKKSNIVIVSTFNFNYYSKFNITNSIICDYFFYI
jgi:hypothetical protein